MDNLDMTTPVGRMVAYMLASFAEMEAENISLRVSGATAFLAHAGRVRGGIPAWPFEKHPQPDGKGYTYRPIPERAEAIRSACEAILAGASSTEIARRWTAENLPRSRPDQSNRGRRSYESWSASTVRNLLRNPALYCATVHRGQVIRDAEGAPRVDPDQAILTRYDWLRLQDVLDSRGHAGRPPSNPSLLHGLAVCASCGSRLQANRDKTRTPDKWRYLCPNRECRSRARVSMPLLDAYVERVWHDLAPHRVRIVPEVVHRGADPKDLALLLADLDDVQARIAESGDDLDSLRPLIDRRKALRAERDRLESQGQRIVVPRLDRSSLVETYDAADLVTRASLLAEAYEAVRVSRAPDYRTVEPSCVDLVPRVPSEADAHLTTLPTLPATGETIGPLSDEDFEDVINAGWDPLTGSWL